MSSLLIEIPSSSWKLWSWTHVLTHMLENDIYCQLNLTKHTVKENKDIKVKKNNKKILPQFLALC